MYAWERSFEDWKNARYVVNGGADNMPLTRGGVAEQLPESNIERFIAEAWSDYFGTAKPPKVVFPGNVAHAATGGRSRVSLPNWAKVPLVILHELAHAMVADKHGPLFVRMYIELMVKYAGKNRSDLVKSAKAAGIKVAPEKAVPQSKRTTRGTTKALLKGA